ncbi:MAG: glycosyltransferase family 2 protein [Bryobacterales bacterium]|nr:glycosyltransferase family 2 protein [Bryobacterales bacterium]
MNPLELAVVIPTFKEKENVEPLLGLLSVALQGVEYEVVFVDDDSPDGTGAWIRGIALRNPRVRVLQRIGRRGLASACIEGMMATPAPYIAVMDADLQHDERILPEMLNRLKSGGLDIVIGSRNVQGGSMGEFAASRVKLSQLGRRLSRMVSHCDLSDPMSGFFMLDRRFLEEVVHGASGVGFKILLDLVASARRPVRFSEIPYTFRNRLRGESKLDILVGLEYLQLLLDKLIGNFVPPRFVIFSMVGAVGAVQHLGAMFLLQKLAAWPFLEAQTAGSLIAMTSNFLLNNSTTYRDRRLRGWRILTGLITFYAACSIGILINLRVADFLKDAGAVWYMAGICGLAIGSVWNYGVTAILTWRQVRRLDQQRQISAHWKSADTQE